MALYHTLFDQTKTMFLYEWSDPAGKAGHNPLPQPEMQNTAVPLEPESYEGVTLLTQYTAAFYFGRSHYGKLVQAYEPKASWGSTTASISARASVGR